MKYLHKTIAKALLVLLTAVLLVTAICGCGNSVQTSTPVTNGKLFIWEISSETTQLYLLGSVHVASQDLYPLDSAIENAFNSAGYLVVEINANNVTQEYGMEMLLKYGTYTDGSGFKNHVSAELYNQLNELFLNHGYSLDSLNNFRPFVIYSVMSELVGEDLGYSSTYGIDFYYMDKAAKIDKTVKELETFEFQLNLLSSIPDESIIEAIAYDIENPETEKDLENIFSAWLDGDVAGLEEFALKPFVDDPDLAPYYEAFYKNRNHNMLQKIEEYLASNDIHFVVVGAGHLVGEDGLINLLQNKGYQIEQLYRSD
jgi:uncharacterized protein